ncbi:MAG: radical SAM protein, partial [Planctomycetota bacterium]|nr:radical SAM protein [Planctomycetota bacterium]
MGNPIVKTRLSEDRASPWQQCRFLTCSVLPVRMACNLHCPFCFSKSSISSLKAEQQDWDRLDVESYYQYAKDKGANRLVITGGGEPLLRPEVTVSLIERARPFFEEIACFSNGTFLTDDLSEALQEAGLSYLCYSRHHYNDQDCRALMGEGAPALSEFFKAAGSLKVRATCVMTQGGIESPADVDEYMSVLEGLGVTEFTFKHTYVAYERSVFGQSAEDQWAKNHKVEYDPFESQGTVLAQLPWGPKIRRIGSRQVCYYFEPQPSWEKDNRLCRSINLLSDGTVYASLEDKQSRL